jgi:hypothetical protein
MYIETPTVNVSFEMVALNTNLQKILNGDNSTLSLFT